MTMWVAWPSRRGWPMWCRPQEIPVSVWAPHASHSLSEKQFPDRQMEMITIFLYRTVRQMGSDKFDALCIAL